jgi:single-stranded DNA-binding protein
VERKDLRKGDLIYVEGKINYMAWDDPSGQKKYSTSITLIHLQTFKAKAKDEFNQEVNGNVADPENEDDMPF